MKNKQKTNELFEDIQILPRGLYMQIVFTLKTLDPTIIRSNEAEEVLTYSYQELGNRFIIPWRKFKGKLRRLVMEQQRSFGFSPDCSLKENLCMKCPSCFLFGGTGETSSSKVEYNLQSRVLGETLISLIEVKDVYTYTANAVDERDYTTGQALMTIVTVPPETEFLGILTLKDPTKEFAAILIDNLDRVTRIGASNREWGRCKISLLGYLLSDREEISVYDLVKEGINKEKIQPIENLNLPFANIKDCYEKIDKEIENLLNKVTKQKQ